jgi:selenide,water dikinase
MTHVVLVGGGHSHVQVLLALSRRRPAGLRLTVVSRDALTPYSGMLPGVIAGHYAAADAHIDLAPLCAAAGAALIHDEAVGLDLASRAVRCAAHPPVSWDLLSINCGSAPGLAAIPGAAAVGLPVKPISQFLPRWSALLRRLRNAAAGHCRLAVVGGGAGGVELALAMHYRLHEREQARRADLQLINAAPALLPGSAPRLGQRLSEILDARGVRIRNGTRVQAAQPGVLVTEGGESLAVDEVLWVTDAGAPDWPGQAGLAVDGRGFVRVDASLRSLSHPEVFAAGDVASLAGHALPKAGVYAVRQGPLLTRNLLRAAAGAPLLQYRPQRHVLMLVSTGGRHAVAARGDWTAEGRWAWYWKDWIDRRFVARFRVPGT